MLSAFSFSTSVASAAVYFLNLEKFPVTMTFECNEDGFKMTRTLQTDELVTLERSSFKACYLSAEHLEAQLHYPEYDPVDLHYQVTAFQRGNIYPRTLEEWNNRGKASADAFVTNENDIYRRMNLHCSFYYQDNIFGHFDDMII